MGDHDGIVVAGVAARFAQTVRIALAVAEPEGVLVHRRQLDGLILLPVEEQRQALVGAEPHVMVAARADPEIALKLPVKNHLLALLALLPQVVRDVGLAEQAAHLGAGESFEPAHDAASCRAARTPSPSARTSASALSRQAAVAPPSASNPSSIAETRAEPTTAASATRATSAA